MLTTDPLECLGYDPAARWLTADYWVGGSPGRVCH
jgi:hypothetical protein